MGKASQFKAMLRDEKALPLAGLREGIEACLVAIAAEKSRSKERVIDMKDIFRKVFGDE